MFNLIFYSVFVISSQIPIAGKISCVNKSELTPDVIRNNVNCSQKPNTKLPLYAKEILDLSHLNSQSNGTCGHFLTTPNHYSKEFLSRIGSINLHKLLRDSKLPLLIKMPRIHQFSDSCLKLCDLGNAAGRSSYLPTAFGFAVRFVGEPNEFLSIAIPKGYAVHIRASKPWHYVTGNESTITPCMDGRPTVLEFGSPFAAVSGLLGSGLGFSTSGPTTEDSYVLIDLQPSSLQYGIDDCSPYRCEN